MQDYRTELPRKVFRWNNGVLEQEVEIIQHYKSDSRDVGVWSEWHPVLINGQKIPQPQHDPYELVSSGDWCFERNSGYAGFRCSVCATWVYENQTKKCRCDEI